MPALLAIALFGAMIIPTASASSPQIIDSTLNFTQSFSSNNNHSFTHRHIQWTATTSAPTSGATSTTFIINLIPGRIHGASGVGERTIRRNGTSQVIYNNAGSGVYHFRFIKTNDGIRIVSNNVRMMSQSQPW